jgi:hypothetical protein
MYTSSQSSPPCGLVDVMETSKVLPERVMDASLLPKQREAKVKVGASALKEVTMDGIKFQ